MVNINSLNDKLAEKSDIIFYQSIANCIHLGYICSEFYYPKKLCLQLNIYSTLMHR